MAKLKRKRPKVWEKGQGLFLPLSTGGMVEVTVFFKGALRAFVVREPSMGWHMAITHERRRPVWEEILDAHETFLPDVILARILFSRAKRLGLAVGPRSVHLHEVPEGPYEEMIRLP